MGRSSGLALLWKSVNSVAACSSSFWHIDVETDISELGLWRLIGFYGRPSKSQRQHSWELLRDLAQQSSLSWVCCGDFNSILEHNEKRGANQQPNNLIQDFREAILDSGLIDFPMSGYRITWGNGRQSVLG